MKLRHIKILTLWLLMALLPLHGLAAVMKPACDGIRHAASHESAHQDRTHAHHLHSASPAGEHAPAHIGEPEASCGACAACCMPAFTAPVALLPAATRPDPVYLCFAGTFFDSHISSAPERPPKHRPLFA